MDLTAFLLMSFLPAGCSGPRVAYRPVEGAPKHDASPYLPSIRDVRPPGSTELGTLEASGGAYGSSAECRALLLSEGQRLGAHVLVLEDPSGACRARIYALSPSDKPFDAP